MRPALLLLCLVPACLPTEFKPATCTADTDCTAIGAGLRCDLSRNVCVCASTAYPGCEKFIDAGTSADGPNDVPVPPVDVIVSHEVTQPDVAAQPDGPADVAIIDATVDLRLLDTAVDTRVPDAAGTCGVASDCPNSAKGFCVGGVCSACSASLCAGRVDGGAAVCATTGTAAGQCVECVAPGQCANPAKSFCVNNACTGCTASLCSGGVDGGTAAVCATSGSSAGQCVECVADSQCTKDPAKGFCVANACTGCNAPGAMGCAARTDGKTTCATTGASAGQCVECSGDPQCTKDPARAFCVNSACTGCNTSGATGCAARTDGRTTCAATGTLAGQCVQCTSSTQCSGTKPICASGTDTCRACAADSECPAAGPGVCMTDGHCATDAEAIYVGMLGSATCLESNAGTAQAPVCSLLNGVGLAKTSSKPVVLIRGALSAGSAVIAVTSPLTIVGRSGATVTATAAASADAITITSGEITLRNLTIQGTASPATGIGIKASPDSGSTVTLHVDTCAVKGNPGGGILLNGANFDIKNTTVTGNGPATFGGATAWGGILISNPPASGSLNLSLVTIQTNDGGGLSCTSAMQGAGVLSTGNNNALLGQIVPACGITACTPASTTCGAQSTPQ